MTKIMMNKADIAIIQQILDEGNITGNFNVIYSNGSGIGYSLDLEYETEVNGRRAMVRIPICGPENW